MSGACAGLPRSGFQRLWDSDRRSCGYAATYSSYMRTSGELLAKPVERINRSADVDGVIFCPG
jgi:hypothetical protein